MRLSPRASVAMLTLITGMMVFSYQNCGTAPKRMPSARHNSFDQLAPELGVAKPSAKFELAQMASQATAKCTVEIPSVGGIRAFNDRNCTCLQETRNSVLNKLFPPVDDLSLVESLCTHYIDADTAYVDFENSKSK